MCETKEVKEYLLEEEKIRKAQIAFLLKAKKNNKEVVVNVGYGSDARHMGFVIDITNKCLLLNARIFDEKYRYTPIYSWTDEFVCLEPIPLSDIDIMWVVK